jgi:ribosomal protein S18 acetylase RimI-like enzyme
MHIKQLTKDDWQAWKELRLEALQTSPIGFGQTFGEALERSDADFKGDVSKGSIFAAVIDDRLVSCIGFYNLTSVKAKHQGNIWGVYTKPEHRGKGIADALLKTVIEHAKTCALQIHLSCDAANHGAIALYQKHGFRIYGTEPRCFKIGNEFFDHHLMVLEF